MELQRVVPPSREVEHSDARLSALPHFEVLLLKLHDGTALRTSCRVTAQCKCTGDVILGCSLHREYRRRLLRKCPGRTTSWWRSHSKYFRCCHARLLPENSQLRTWSRTLDCKNTRYMYVPTTATAFRDTSSFN